MTGSRAMTARDEFRYRKQTKAATIIQAHFRCYSAYSYYTSLRKAAIVTQCGWRQRVARKELRMLKMAARETGALKEAKDKLEKRVEELTWRLWPLGVLIYFMLQGEMPFGSWRENELDTFAKIAKGQFTLPETFSREVVDLITKLLEVDENERLGSKEHVKKIWWETPLPTLNTRFLRWRR
ncbi:hypothetical protein L6452_19234 [Arctium lappa]|uniref:Uncharacterized protein n=1 Tax=Arctium lappa TaxID=4217 RepID=A0ACB9B7G3_ARCLA|nr:hypothetical protein L6452_19234 [Arctium lappa]